MRLLDVMNLGGGGGLSDLNPMRTCTAEQWVTM